MDVNLKFHPQKLIVFVSTFFILLSNACAPKKEESLPADIIGKDTMILILTEIHMLESSLSIRIFEDKKLMNTRNAIKPQIYKNYGVTKEQFFKSYTYYASKPALIDSIYTDVITGISKRQAEQIKK